MYSIGEHTLNYQIPEMKFQDSKGSLRVVRGQHTYLNQVVTCKIMRSILRHVDMEWAPKCNITSPEPNIKVFEHPKEIEKLLKKYEFFLEIFHMVDHLIGGLSTPLFWWGGVFNPFKYHFIEIPRNSAMILRRLSNNS